jgi:hypothetical protein
MPLPALLARLHHLTLTVACVCLIVALQPMVPRLTPFLWPLAMLALMAGRLGDRWLLPARLADALALVATVATLVWIFVSDDLLRERWVPLVPSLGPLVLLLLVLRLYRSRERRDLWLLQGMGLLLVALACTLTTAGYFGLLLLLYVVLALPLLALAQLDEARRRAGLPEESVPAPRLGWRTVAWAALVFGGALLLFLLAPRLSWQSWDPLQQIGVDPSLLRFPGSTFSQSIDLNRTGDVKLGSEEAFRVYLLQGENTGELPGDIRWRTGILDRYQNGRWTAVPRRGPFRNPGQTNLPALGPDRMRLRFIVAPRPAGGLVLAEPILFAEPPTRLPVIYPDLRENLFAEANGTLLTSFALGEGTYQYQQVTLPNRDRWPLVLPGPTETTLPGLVQPLLNCPVPELATWTRGRLEQLAAEERHGLVPETPLPEPGAIPANAEELARALTAYLATSGEYGYTLTIAREDHGLDPVLDFLVNVRQGHCERYAGALTLMLRTQGIPARIVRGFRGAEASGEGFYVVYQSSAHAWVEALVPKGDGPELEWIALDPTPAGEVTGPTGFTWSGLWQQLARWQDVVWRELIVGYGATQQSALWQNRLASGSLLAVLLAVAVVVLLALLLRRWLRRPSVTLQRGPVASLPFLQRLWTLLRRHGLLHFDPSRTPRELARAAAAALANSPAAGLPAQIVELFYRIRFGGVEADAEVRQAETALGELERLLALPQGG